MWESTERAESEEIRLVQHAGLGWEKEQSVQEMSQ